MSLVIGVDVATADVRAVAVDGSGSVVAAASGPLPSPRHERAGWSEQDSVYGEAVLAVLAALAAQLPGDVEALAVTSTSGTVMPCDGRLRAVGPALLYDDRRAGEPGSGVDASLVRALPGLARIAWLERHRRAPRYAHAADVVYTRLAGRPGPTDTSTALKSGADPATGRWDEEALAQAGVHSERLPALGLPASPAGTLGRTAARSTGLRAGLPLVLGMTDGCTGQIAAAGVDPGSRVTILGTTLVLKTVAERRIVDDRLGVYSHRGPDGRWWPGGASNAGGGAIDERDATALAALDAAAAARGPVRTLVYPVARPGERFPFVSSDAGGYLTGPAPDPVERHRAILEGVAFVERLGFEVLAARGAAGEGPVRTVGGGTRSATWLAIRASVLGATQEIPAQPGSAFGAAILAAVGSLHGSLSDAVASMVRIEKRVFPDPSQQPALEAGYRRFVAALEARGWMAR